MPEFICLPNYSVMDDKDPNLHTWLGPAPPLEEGDLLVAAPTIDLPKDFVEKFNFEPIEAIEVLKASFKQFSESSVLPSVLFCTHGLYPQQISRYIFKDESNARSFLFNFFSSINLDYIDLVDSMRFCFSRIAFPNKQTQLKKVFEAFADAYTTANPFTKYTHQDIFVASIACIAFSLFNRMDSIMSLSEFSSLLKNTSFGEDDTALLFEAVKLRPIPVFFSFASSEVEPNYQKAGYLRKIGGMFKGKKQRYFTIDGFTLKYYRNETLTEQLGEVELDETVAKYEPPTKKEAEHLVIKKFDGGPIGYKVIKGQKKRSNHHEYVAYGQDRATLQSWISACNFVSFWSILNQFINSTVRA